MTGGTPDVSDVHGHRLPNILGGHGLGVVRTLRGESPEDVSVTGGVVQGPSNDLPQ